VSRVQLALNVTDLDAAIDFYRAVFGAEPAKVRPGYANFAVADPPLKLVLIEGAEGGTLNHLGVEVEGTEQVTEAATRLSEAGLTTDERAGETCCYAVQDKVWVQDPDRAPWEIYTVLEDADRLAPERGEAIPAGAGVTGCC
jgi:catechol 2,3-dioxygenase-like lactoylglutathione lyase family enzyme